jgi:hypothetical protein
MDTLTIIGDALDVIFLILLFIILVKPRWFHL